MTVVLGTAVQEAQQANSAARLSAAVFGGYTQPQEDELVLGSLQHGDLRLRKAIRLSVRLIAAQVELEWPEAAIKVVGPTTGDALTSLRSVILDRVSARDEAVLSFFAVPQP